MKYVNKIAVLLLLSSVMGVVGCASNSNYSKINLVVGKDDTANLVSTQEYVPVPEVDGAGVAIPYVPAENPYLAQRGKVKKESVIKYIEAKRTFKNKQYDQSTKLLMELTAEDKKLSGPWMLLGDIEVEKKNYDKAAEYYLKAIELNKDNVNAYVRLAKAQRIQGHFLNAQNTYAKVLALWSDFPEAHLNLAILYDIYLNHPLRAQKHMEAYQFLTGGEDKNVAKWLTEIQQRTGVATSLTVDKPKAESKPLS